MQPDGQLSDPIQRFAFPNEGSNLHAAVFSKAGDLLFVANTGGNEIRVFSVDESSNTPLTELTQFRVDVPNDAGPRHMVFDAAEEFLYVVETRGGNVTVYRHEAGELTLVQRIQSYSVVEPGNRPTADIKMSRDGRFIYANNRDGDDTVSVFSVNQVSGLLTLEQHAVLRGSGSTAITLDPSNNFLIVTCTRSDSLDIFSRNSDTGLLTLTSDSVTGMSRPYSLVMTEGGFGELSNLPPTVSFAANTVASIESGYSYLEINADASDSDGTIAQVELFLDGVSVDAISTASYTWNTNQAQSSQMLGLSPGIYELEVVATDDDGATANAMHILEVVENDLPVASVVRVRDGGEGDTNPRFELRLSSAGSTSIQVTVSFSGTAEQGTDFTSGSSRVIDSSDLEKRVTISVIDDFLFEGEETVIVSLNQSDEYQIDPNNASATISISDNDPDPGDRGFPNVPQVAGAELGSAVTDSADGRARTVVMDYYKGFILTETREKQVDGRRHSVEFWDISDPSNPFIVTEIGADRGQHTAYVYLPHHRVNSSGDRYLNFEDPFNPFYENPEGYVFQDLGPRHASLPPYQYSGGENIFIYNAQEGVEQTIDEPLSSHRFRGQSTVIGNLLLFLSIRDRSRYVATYDVSDPMNPQFFDVLNMTQSTSWDPDTAPAYESFIWKHFIVMPNVTGTDDAAFIDFSDPRSLRPVTYLNRIDQDNDGDSDYRSGLPGRTRYAQFQDNYMFLGGGKYDMSPLENDEEPTLELTFLEQNGEYMLPVGNLLISAENTDQGSIQEGANNGQSSGGPFPFKIFAHQAQPDTTPPTVGYHIPVNGATQQHVKSRIGVVIHETLDYTTINDSTFRVFATAGGSVLSGTYNAHDKDVLTFTPEEDLEEWTQYTVQLEGIADAAGNQMQAYSFIFTTGGEGEAPPIEIVDLSQQSYPAFVNSSTSFSVTAIGGDGDFEYRWNLGDGTIIGWNENNSTISHTYSQPGHYAVTVQVRDGNGSRQNETTRATAVNLVSGPRPIHGSQIILSSSGQRVWSVFPDNNRVLSIDTSDNSIQLNVDLGEGSDPRGLAENGNGDIWVTSIDADRIDIIDPSDGSLQAIALPRGSRPNDIVFDHTKTYAYISLKGSGEILRIDTSTYGQTYVEAGPMPSSISINPEGTRLFVTRFITGSVSGEVRSFDISSGITLVDTFQLIEDTVSEEDGNQGRGLPNYLADVVVSYDGQYAYVSAKKDNIRRGDFLNGSPLTHETTVRAIVSQIDLSSGLELFEQRVDIDNSSQPTAMAFSTYGDYLFVALQGNNRVDVIDAFTNTLVTSLETGLAPQGLVFDDASRKLYVKNLNQRSIVILDLSSALVDGDFTAVTSETVTLPSQFEIMAANVLQGKQIFYNASDPRMSLQEYISCALCHQDGSHDGRTWDFTDRGEGLRNTTNLRGRAGMGHGNVHWSANFDEIQDFEHDMQGPFGGTGFMEGEDTPLGTPKAGRSPELDALAAYVESLGIDFIEKSPNRNYDGGLTADGLAGKRLFEGEITPASGRILSCMTCHSSESAFTDSMLGGDSAITLADIGTLRASSGQRLGAALSGIDTPTLWGLHASAPYLHDGRADSIEEVFDYFDSDAEFGTEGAAHNLGPSNGYNLTADERRQLFAFLEQIDGPIITGAISAQNWLLSWGMDIGGENDNFDGDSLSNYEEYVYGMNPLIKDPSDESRQPGLMFENGEYLFRFVRRTNDPNLNYTLYSSPNLVDWDPVAESDFSMESIGEFLERVDLEIDVDGENKFFYRLEVR
ncbi:MAG: beta-propeller fold lactonase family protein [Verrucomicrobiota bacterium]